MREETSPRRHLDKRLGGQVVMTHPTEDDLAAYVAGLLTEMQSRELADHLAACPVRDRAASDYRDTAAAVRSPA